MRILLDLQAIQNASSRRGIGRFSLSFAKSVAANAGPHQVYLLLSALFAKTIDAIRLEFGAVLADDRILVFDAPGPVDEFNVDNRWRRLAGEALRQHAIDCLAPDVVVISSLFEGAQDDTLVSVGSVSSDVAVAAILHDLIPLTDPKRYLGDELAAEWYHNKVGSLRRADLLLAVSASAASEAVALLDIDPARVCNVSSAADRKFLESRLLVEEATPVARRLGINRKFLMHSSAFEPRKNFERLVAAFAALPDAIRRDYQLVFVCKIGELEREALASLARSAGLGDGELVLTGYLEDADLIALYTCCHLFVFPSLHEGFGLPPLEAMSCGAAVIGSNTTSLPEVIGRVDATFDPLSTSDMTALMLKCLTDQAFYRSLKDHAHVQSRKFSMSDTARRAVAALESLVRQRSRDSRPQRTAASRRAELINAIAELTRQGEASEAELYRLASCIERNEKAARRLQATAYFAAALHWRLEGPFDSSYSLATLNRQTARALTELGHSVALHSTEGPGDIVPDAEFLRANPDLAMLHQRASGPETEKVDVVSRNLYPPRVADMAGRLKILHEYAWEETGFPAAWVDDFNEHLQGLVCVSSHVDKLLVDNGVHVPIVVAGCGVDHWEGIAAAADFFVAARRFRFLHVSSCFPRKGIDVLLEAYGRAFSGADDVSLVIKTFANPHNDIDRQLGQWQAQRPDHPHVVLIQDELDDVELKSLFGQCHVLVAPSRAEGFGLPMAEAMLSGLPVITTGWGGQTDFCNAKTAWLIDYTFEPAQTHLSTPGSVWARPDVDHLTRTLRQVHQLPATVLHRVAEAGRSLLLDTYRWADVAAVHVDAARAFGSAAEQALPSPRIGWVTTWNTRCGIASYSEHLLAALPEPVMVLAPHQQDLVRQDDDDRCVRCWLTGKDDNAFEELDERIGDHAIDTLVVQFNYGFFNLRQLARFIDRQVDDGRVVVVMVHSTGDPGLEPSWNWTLATLAPAFARCQRILVHSVADLNRLKAIGLTANVALFPHGVLQQPDLPRDARPLDAGAPLIASYGYCLPHKGLTELVYASDILRRRGMPVRLRLVNAEFPEPASRRVVADLRRLINELGLESLVETHHEYLADDQSLRLLRDADLIVYAYQNTHESASGAVRYGLAAQRPVAVTPLPIFDELGGAVHRFPGGSAEALADGISRTLSLLSASPSSPASSGEAQAVASAASAWCSAHGHAALARRLFDICRALRRRARPKAYRFDGSSPRLQSEIGRVEGRAIASTGVAGLLVQGPGVALPAGRHDILVDGRRGARDGGDAHLSVTTGQGRHTLLQLPLGAAEGGQVAAFRVHLRERCSDLEIRIVIDSRTDLSIDSIRISPSAAAPWRRRAEPKRVPREEEPEVEPTTGGGAPLPFATTRPLAEQARRLPLQRLPH